MRDLNDENRISMLCFAPSWREVGRGDVGNLVMMCFRSNVVKV
jgi:hypothetical protein